MLLWFLFWTSLRTGTSLANAAEFSTAMTSSCPDVSGCHCAGLRAHCIGNDSVYANAVQTLPSDLETLVFSLSTTEDRLGLDLQMGGGFARFWNLRTLKLQLHSKKFYSDYSIHNATASVFCKLTNLQNLHLNVRLRSLPPDAVQCLTTLDTLDLSDAHALYTDDLKAVLAAPLSRHITTLLLRNVQRFNDAGSYMKEVNFATLFSGLNLRKLRVLDLAGNSFIDLKPGLLPLLMPNLEKLDLSGNLFGIQSVWPRSSLLTMMEIVCHPSLQELICMNQGFYPNQEPVSNRERQRHQRLRDEKTQLKRKNIRESTRTYQGRQPVIVRRPIPEISSQVDSFNVLSTSDCIQNIPIGKHLSTINARGFLRECPPYRNLVPTGTFCFNPDNNLKEIDVSNMQLAQFFADPSLINVSVSGLTKLEVLNARNNDLTAHYTTFLNIAPTFLRKLLFGGNRMKVGPSHLEPYGSLKLLTLQHLDLLRNGLSTIPQKEFLRFPNMQILDLSGNKLENVNLELPESLQLLNISGNKLTFLKDDVTNRFDSFKNLTVDMTSNYLVCGCQAYHFVHWIKHTETHLTNKDDLYCFTETGQVRMAQIDLHSLHKKCNPLTWLELTAIGAAASTPLFLLVFLCFLMYRRRWGIRHYIYRRRLRREWADLNDDYEYDAFVAYNDETPEVRRWVNVTMQTEMEQNRGLRLFLHQRDLLAGGFHQERIDDAMGRCRKTMLVLSPDFLRSRICLYQAWSAHTSMTTEQRNGYDVVLVRLQVLPAAEITGSLATLMENREGLTWVEDSEGQNLFWERLEHALVSPPVNT